MIILRTEDIKLTCTDILAAVDSNVLSKITETLEIIAKDGLMKMNVTNGEYYATVTLPISDKSVDMHATVNADVFLKLIARTTTETVELEVEDTTLKVNANGNYKIPLIYEGEELLNLPEIKIENETNSFNINTKILTSIMNYNSKELQRGFIAMPVQKLYYVDDKGAITFTSGACVNDFTLEKPVKLLLTQKLVNLFKIFTDSTVKFTLGQDMVNNIIQTKVKFETTTFSVTSIIPSDEGMLNSVPVDAIRNRAHDTYTHTVVLDKSQLLQTIDRLLLFSSNNLKLYSKFEFNTTSVKIYDVLEDNFEEIYYANSTMITEPYEAVLDLVDIKNTFSNFRDQYINLRFGNKEAIVVNNQNIYIVIPEVLKD